MVLEFFDTPLTDNGLPLYSAKDILCRLTPEQVQAATDESIVEHLSAAFAVLDRVLRDHNQQYFTEHGPWLCCAGLTTIIALIMDLSGYSDLLGAKMIFGSAVNTAEDSLEDHFWITIRDSLIIDYGVVWDGHSHYHDFMPEYTVRIIQVYRKDKSSPNTTIPLQSPE